MSVARLRSTASIIFFKSLAGNMDERIGHSGPFSTNLVGFVAVVVTLNPKLSEAKVEAGARGSYSAPSPDDGTRPYLNSTYHDLYPVVRLMYIKVFTFHLCWRCSEAYAQRRIA